MRVRRIGRVFGAEMGPSWMYSHAAYPTPQRLSATKLRIYFCCRDSDNRGMVAWIDVDPTDPRRILAVAKAPSLTVGALGAFDDRGISIGSINEVGGDLRLYYMGWNKSADVPFRNAIGMAVTSDATKTGFVRPFLGPLLDRSRHDPFTLSYPFVMPGSRDQPWRMIYGTSRRGGTDERLMDHVLVEATSNDGIDWRPTGRVVVNLEAEEYGVSRPWLITTRGDEWLLYSIRRRRYTIGLSRYDATSASWRRESSDFLGPSVDSWEDEAQCYPAAIAVADSYYLFYCGNGYGRTGFGVAELLM